MCACICISVHLFLSWITRNTWKNVCFRAPRVFLKISDQISQRARSQLISGAETSRFTASCSNAFLFKIPCFNAPTGAEVILAVTQPGSSPKVITLGWHLLWGQPLPLRVIVSFKRKKRRDLLNLPHGRSKATNSLVMI